MVLKPSWAAYNWERDGSNALLTSTWAEDNDGKMLSNGRMCWQVNREATWKEKLNSNGNKKDEKVKSRKTRWPTQTLREHLKAMHRKVLKSRTKVALTTGHDAGHEIAYTANKSWTRDGGSTVTCPGGNSTSMKQKQLFKVRNTATNST